MAASWLQQYTRMCRLRSRLGEVLGVDDARKVDDFYAFFASCYHLKDWIKNDDTVPKNVRDKVESFVKGSPSLALSGDITNGVKHLKRDEGRARIHPGAHVSAIGRFQPGALQLAGIVVMGDRETSDAMQLADNCIQEWTSFLCPGSA